MRKTKGFLTKDGVFFEEEVNARVHEAEVSLREICTVSVYTNDVSAFITAIRQFPHCTLEFASALVAQQGVVIDEYIEQDETKAEDAP